MTNKAFLFIPFLLLGSLAMRAQDAPVTDEEAMQWAHRMEAATTGRDAEVLEHLFALDSLLELIKEKADALQDPAFMNGFQEGFTKSMRGFGTRMAASIGNYHLLSEYDRNGHKHLLFRAFGDEGLNYHDFTLVKVKGSVRACDVFVFTSGEELSSTMATLVQMMAGGSLHKISQESKDFVQLRDCQKRKDWVAAKNIYDQMDSRMHTKAVQVMYIDICRHLNDSLYEKSMEDFAGEFPDAPNTYLLMIDFYYLKKQYAKGMDALDNLDRIIGKDPFLDFYRGNFSRLNGMEDESLVYYDKVYKYDPDMAINTRVLIASYALAGQYDQAKAVISEYKKATTFRQKDLDQLYATYPKLK